MTAHDEPAPELFRTIAEYTYAWEAWVDQHGKVRWPNAAVERITGVGVAASPALPDYPLPLVHPADRTVVAAILEDAARAGSGNDVEFRVVHASGEHRWVAISWQSVEDASG